MTVEGRRYDSTLEYNVNVELQRLGLVLGRDFEHHLRVDGIYYEPDFTIHRSPHEFRFPRWIEVKPPEAIYALRDHQRLPERFNWEEEVWMTEAMVRDVVPELSKPKRLAEMTGAEVLVVSKLNGHETLSATMGPEHVVLTRRHPGVNWPGHVRRMERVQQRAAWDELRANLPRAAAPFSRFERTDDVDSFFADVALVNAQYGGFCWRCGAWKEGADLYRAAVKGEADRWPVICRAHVD